MQGLPARVTWAGEGGGGCSRMEAGAEGMEHGFKATCGTHECGGPDSGMTKEPGATVYAGGCSLRESFLHQRQPMLDQACCV